jgi:fructuronate reductase
MKPRISRDTLSQLASAVRRPDFDPAGLKSGIVHIGLGAFVRAHLASYTQPLLAGEQGWGILGVSLRNSAMRDALAPQDNIYICAERGAQGERLTAMAALTGILVAHDDPGAVVAALADPATRIVTLTVTEKGYHRLNAQGDLDENDPLIQRDLANPHAPCTLPGFLTAAIRARREAGTPNFTVLSCDNLSANGESTRRVVAQFAGLLDSELARFIEDNVAFPNSMVDRIVPATTDADRERVEVLSAVRDAWPVVCEPFSQWVIEDCFPLGRPAWESRGVEIVSDVRPYEKMKLRILNGSHSAIAYLGQLAGWQTVADAVAYPELASFINALMQEAASTLFMPASVDLRAYSASLFERFANPALCHRTGQIAMDGSQKIPQRLFATSEDRLSRGFSAPCAALATAAWLRFLQGRDDAGAILPLDDPMKERLRKVARDTRDPRSLCDAIFAMQDIVPTRLAQTSFRDDVLAALQTLMMRGTRETLNEWKKWQTS